MDDPASRVPARESGVLMPLPALSGRFAIGDFGPAALRFADFLAACGQRVWQLLPLSVTTSATGNSPYNGLSAAALDPLLVSPEWLVEDRLLEPADLLEARAGQRIRYGEARRQKGALLGKARRAHRRDARKLRDFAEYREREARWLEDFALFRVLRQLAGGRPWTEWPLELRDREPGALRRLARDQASAVDGHAFGQYLAQDQWQRLRRELTARGIEAMGDLPFYVAHDSADAWAHPVLFALDAAGRPTRVSGCPPDVFTAAGQLWGQPVYRWEAHHSEGFSWWLGRVERQLALFDRLRIDHFRGLAATWQVPARAATAEAGAWVESPGRELIKALRRRFPRARWVAEDLGVLSAEVHALRSALGAPCTRVLQFGFGEDFPTGEHLPERTPREAVLYSGTHDNDTLRGWLERGAGPDERRRLRDYLGDATPAEAAAELLRRCLASPAELVVLPLQDLLGLGSRARINRPGQPRGQWTWRLASGGLDAQLAAAWREHLSCSGRLGGGRLGD